MAFQKDPDAVLDYMVDWTRWLGTDTIATSDWIVPTGITETTATATTTTATIWLSGGTPGVSYSIVNRIITSAGRADDRTIVVECRSGLSQ